MDKIEIFLNKMERFWCHVSCISFICLLIITLISHVTVIVSAYGAPFSFCVWWGTACFVMLCGLYSFILNYKLCVDFIWVKLYKP